MDALVELLPPSNQTLERPWVDADPDTTWQSVVAVLDALAAEGRVAYLSPVGQER